MPVKSLKKIPVHVFIPPIYDPIHKIEIVGSNTYDVTDIIHSGEITNGVTDTIGTFKFVVDNSEETYTDAFSLYDVVNVYLDYATTATTLRFKGLIEKVSKAENTIIVTGRSTAAKVMGITVTKQYTSEYTHTILENLISSYSDVLTTTNIDTTESTDTQITVSWNQKPFWECILEICSKAGYECYIDENYDVHYFVSNTRNNTTDVIVHDQNLFETGDFAPDLSIVKNRIIVYGAKIEEMQIIATAEDTDSQTAYGIKEEIINDSTIITTAQAQARADYELAAKKDPPIIGDVISYGLATLAPGERLRISDPQNGIAPNYYPIQKYTHKFSNDEPMQTTVTITKETSTLPRILKKRITFETQSTEFENINELRYSWIFDFNTDSGTHSDTQITEGVLNTGGEVTGTWISDNLSVTSDITACELRANGDNLPGNVNYYISTDGGVVWQLVSNLNTLFTPNPPGSTLKLKIVINSATTNLDSLMLLYK